MIPSGLFATNRADGESAELGLPGRPEHLGGDQGALVDGVGFSQRKRSDLGIERVAAVRDHLKGSVHRAERGLQRTKRRVLERLPRREQGLLSHDTRTADLLDVSVGVGDDPMPREQLNRARSLVTDLDRVAEEPPRGESYPTNRTP